jgi:hypothetical protein
MEHPMRRTLAWPSTANLIRAEFTMFHNQGDQLGLSEDDRRAVLDLDEPTWTAWADFAAAGPLPANPSAPEMLRRLAQTAFYLAVIEERSATQS